MSDSVMVTIVGAGPFGLSIAAHLAEAGVEYRIIGKPMEAWRCGMLKGMQLKSAPFASRLHAPGDSFSLRHYCALRGLDWHDLAPPVPLQLFVEYGLAFQEKKVPQLEDDQVYAIEPAEDSFLLRTRSGQRVLSRRVVLATGLQYFRNMPAVFEGLPAALCSHSSQHHDLSGFAGKRVAVVGGGASAVDSAILLREAGAEVQVITRRPGLDFGTPWTVPSQLGWARRVKFGLRHPLSPIGRGWAHVACSEAPDAYRALPANFRLEFCRTFLGPAAGWDMKARAGGLAVESRSAPEKAWQQDGEVHLDILSRDGKRSHWAGDHVLCATGFQTDIARLNFLSPALIERVKRLGTTPRLSATFESSVPGLYFAGPMSASTFGPLMRFTAATPFTARRLAAALRGSRSQYPFMKRSRDPI